MTHKVRLFCLCTLILVNWATIFFQPNFERSFGICQGKIEWQTKYLDRELSTAGLEDAKRRDTTIMALVRTASDNKFEATVAFPFRFIQDAPRNDQFFGRRNILDEIDFRLRPDDAAKAQQMRSVVLYGLGGCGKSSIAKEYMYREHNTGKYEVILWIFADTPQKLEIQFIALARHLGIETTESEARHATLSWINKLGKGSPHF